MNVFFCVPCWPCLFIVLANVDTTKNLEHGSESDVNYFSGEFENFLHGLGSMVYKKPVRQATDKEGVSNGHGSDYIESTVLPTRAFRRNEKMYRTQKEVLKDVLMMKLVSYYENKYKIKRTENQDLLLITTPVPVVANNYHTFAEYDELQRIHNNDENLKNMKRRSEASRASPQATRQFRNTVMHPNLAEVIVI